MPKFVKYPVSSDFVAMAIENAMVSTNTPFLPKSQRTLEDIAYTISSAFLNLIRGHGRTSTTKSRIGPDAGLSHVNPGSDYSITFETAFSDLAAASSAFLEPKDDDLEPMDVGIHGILSKSPENEDVCMGYVPIDDIDGNDDLMTAFRELSAGALGSMTYERSRYSGYLSYPAEIREMIMHQYLLMERQESGLSEHQHNEESDSRCCVWDYPDVLTACDSQDGLLSSLPRTNRCPQGWLPPLAYTSKQLLDEVMVFKVRRTARLDVRYKYQNPDPVKESNRNPDFCVATWLREFLSVVPGGNALAAVKHLNFPDMDWSDHMDEMPSLTNAGIDLAVACRRNLRRLDMAFHAEKVSRHTDEACVPHPVEHLVSSFHFAGLLQCENLESVHFNGIYCRPSAGGSPADLGALEGLGKWLIMGSSVARDGRTPVMVQLVSQWGLDRKGCPVGKRVTLDAADLIEVARDMSAAGSSVVRRW